MLLNILNAKIERNGLKRYAGIYFRDATSTVIKSLNKEGKKALAGIQKGDGMYTILGEGSVYYTTTSGSYGEISLKSFLEILHENALKKGRRNWFRNNYKFLKINDNEVIWLHDMRTMESLWNTVLWLEKLD